METATETTAAGSTQQEAEKLSVQSIIDAIIEDEGKRPNVFAECIKDGTVTVSTPDQASEIARLITGAEDEVERTKAIAAEMVARAESRFNNLNALFLAPLEVWTSAKLVGQKRRSILLPGGKLAFRKVTGGTRYINGDNKPTLAWALEFLPEAVEMKPTIKTDAVIAWEELNKTTAVGREATVDHDSFSVSSPK